MPNKNVNWETQNLILMKKYLIEKLKALRQLFVRRSFVYEKITELPNSEYFDCEIETPQFHASQDKFHLHRQCGTYHKKEMKFYPFKSVFGIAIGGDHDVQFYNQNDIVKSIVRLR